MKDSLNNFIITGKVIRGDGYGRKIGFPTINLESDTREFPASGVYVGEVILDGKVYKAGIVIDPNNKVEAHLLGYKENAYGKIATFKLEKFLRKYKKFSTEEKLIIQIKKDLSRC